MEQKGFTIDSSGLEPFDGELAELMSAHANGGMRMHGEGVEPTRQQLLDHMKGVLLAIEKLERNPSRLHRIQPPATPGN